MRRALRLAGFALTSCSGSDLDRNAWPGFYGVHIAKSVPPSWKMPLSSFATAIIATAKQFDRLASAKPHFWGGFCGEAAFLHATSGCSRARGLSCHEKGIFLDAHANLFSF
jgi:hypothetical protein